LLQHEKRKVLESIESEDELRTELVIPLLKKMGTFTDVLDNQGATEAGVDVIAVSTSPFKKPEYTAFVLKKGNITLKASDQKNNVFNIVQTQIRMAIGHPLTHPRLPSEKAYANRVIVLTNGTISNNAESAFKKAFVDRSDISLDFVGQDRLIDQIDQLWPRFYEDRRPFLSTYALKLYQSLNTVNFEELGYANRERPLSDIYIDALLYEEQDVASTDLVFDKDAIQGEKLCRQRHGLMAVTSGPGGGKSTLLKEIAISESQQQKDCIAVYMHARAVLESVDVVHAAAKALSELSNDSIDEILPEIVPDKLLLLVDGLDEIASVPQREEVIARLKEANSALGARVVVGTRPESHPHILAAMAGFKAYSISPLRLSQIKSFFGKWFGGNADKAAKLVTAMQDKGVFDKLPRTPMTMTLVAIVYESKEDIPSTLTELYEMFVGLLTGKWDANRKISSPFDSHMKLSFLNRLAWVMQSERLDTISQERCLELADDFFRNQATLEGVDARAFVQSIIDRSHIVIPTGADEIRFSHMTFQEYFCAEYLSRDFPETNLILEWFGDGWWREVLFFLAGMRKDISKLVKDLLAADYDDPMVRSQRLLTLGSMLQAAYLTASTDKNRAVRFAAGRFLHCYDDYRTWIEEAASPKTKRRFSRGLLTHLLTDLFADNFSSIYLENALQDTFKLPPTQEHEAARFLAACALAKLKKFDPLLEFATLPSMINPSMYLVANVELYKQNMTDEEQEKYKRLRKRMQQFGEALKRETRGGYLGPRRRSPKLVNKRGAV
jgi:hypothetical protein